MYEEKNSFGPNYSIAFALYYHWQQFLQHAKVVADLLCKVNSVLQLGAKEFFPLYVKFSLLRMHIQRTFITLSEKLF